MRKIVSVFLALLFVFSSFGLVSAESADQINKQTDPIAEAERVLGDINADGFVDLNDAVALFRHIMLPEMYLVDYPGTLDFEKNDLVDINDALRLFRYSMFPDQYPIEWGTEPIESVLMADLKSYTIIYPEESSNEVQRAGFMLRNKLTPKAGRQLKFKSDAESTEISEYEIVIGKCDRDESRQFSAQMKLFDYGYTVIGKKVVISGGSDEAIVEAIYSFIQNVIQKGSGDSEIFFSNADAVTERRSYELSHITLQGSDISEYAVVYPNGNAPSKNLAVQFVRRIAEKVGTVMAIRSDEEPTTGKEILIGATNRYECSAMASGIKEGTCQFGAEGNYVYARGTNEVSDYYAMFDLIDAILTPAVLNQEVVLPAAIIKEVPVEDNLKAMSFNVYYDSMTADRLESVRQTIVSYMPDTLGVQEATPEWMVYLQSVLGAVYDYVGFGRDGGRDGEASAIFYKRDRFELIESGTKWLSETPDVVSKFDEAGMNRVMTYALLLDKKSNTEVLAANTHLDHINSAARELQVGVLLDVLKEYSEYPIVLTGDFNTGPGSTVYRMVTERFADSSEIAETAVRHGTYHNYGSSSYTLDYAFVSEEKIGVSHYRVITEKMNGRLPSDHYALIIEYNLLH